MLSIKRKKIIIRRVCLAALILLLSVLQNTDGFFPQLFGIRALILIPAVVCTSMFERDIAGMLFGAFAGALWDVFSQGGDFNALFLLCVGFICGTLINTIMRNNIVTASLLSIVAATLYSIGYWLIHYFIADMDNPFRMLARYYLPAVGYTVVFAPILFIIVRAIEKKLSMEN